MALSKPPRDFIFDESVAILNSPLEDVLNIINATLPEPLFRLATGSIIFSQHHDDPQPRVLLVQRAATDSMPNKWEVPGGAVDPGETVLDGAVREVYEEAGLAVKRVVRLLMQEGSQIRPDGLGGGYLFHTRSGKKILKYSFMMEVEDTNAITLDPIEHQDYLWATEEECRTKKVVRSGQDGGRDVDLEFTMIEQEIVIYEGFAARGDFKSASIALIPSNKAKLALRTSRHLPPPTRFWRRSDTEIEAMQSPPSSEWDEEFFDSSKPLQGVVVCCTSIPANERTDLGNKVAELGGQHEYDLTPKTTHLIVGEYDTTKYRHVAKSRPDIKAMAVGWVDAIRNLWVEDNPVDFRALERQWTLRTFETGGGALQDTGERDQLNKLTCCISGMEKEERDEWIAKIEANGGNYSGSLDRNVTHLIILQPTGKKYLASRKWGQRIVVPQWMEDSISRGMILDEACYDPHLPRRDIGRGSWTKRESDRPSLGKRLRDAAERQSESSRRKLRKTASLKLSSQRENMWGEILAQQPSADQPGASLQAEEPTQPLPSESMLRNHSEQVTVKDSLYGASGGPGGIFATCLFHIAGFPRQHVDVLVDYITSRGGIMAASIAKLASTEVSGRRFVVVPQASSSSSHPPVADGVETVTDFFIEKCVYRKGTSLPDSKAHVIGRPFPVFPIESFDKLSICTSGFTELDLLHISKVVRQLGARYEERFTAQCSILVCTSLGAVRKQKLDMALAFGTPVVRADWLWECISEGRKLPSQDFIFPELKSRKTKALPNKALNRSKSSSDINKKLTPKSLTGCTESSRASLPGPDLSAFEETPLAPTDTPQPLFREKNTTKESNLTPDFETAPTHQSQPDTGSQQLPSRPVSHSGPKALFEWSANDINKTKSPSKSPRKPFGRIRSEICDSEAGDDEGLIDLADDDGATAAQDTLPVDDPVEIEKRRIQQEKAEKAAAERKALSNKLTSLLESAAGNTSGTSLESSISGAAADECGRAVPGPPPSRRKRNIIGRVVSNVSTASSVSQESSVGRSGGGMARTHSAVIHRDDSPDDDEHTASTGPAATQIEYADPEASRSKDRLRKKMLGQQSSGVGAAASSAAGGKITVGIVQESSAVSGSRSMRRR